MFNNLFHEEILHDVQSEPPHVQLEVTSSCPVAGCPGEEHCPPLASTSFQAALVVIGSPLTLFFLQAKHPQLSLLLLI